MACNVDLPTGRFSIAEIDLEITGEIPLVWRRHYRSTNAFLGDLGYGWGHAYGEHLWLEGDRVIYRGSDGRRFPFPLPAAGRAVVLPADRISLCLVSGEKLPSAALQGCMEAGAYAIQVEGHATLLFDVVPWGAFFPLRGVCNKDGIVTQVEPAGNGLPARLIDIRGRVVQLVRNADGLIEEIYLAESADAPSRIFLASYVYDEAKNLVAVRDTAGTRVYRYDDKRRMIMARDRCGGMRRFEYDDKDRCILTSGPGDFLLRRYKYDPACRRTVVLDSLGNESAYEYNENGAVVRTVDPAGGVSEFTYDGNGRLIMARDPAGQDILITCAAKIRSDGTIEGVELNERGEMIGIFDASGTTHEFQRDVLGHVVELRRKGRGTCKFEYTQDGKMEKVRTPDGRIVSLKWTSDCRTLAESDSGGVLTEQTFDVIGRLTRFRDAVGATTHYRYGTDGYLAEIVHPDGVAERFQHDAEGRLLSFTDGNGGGTRWTYNEAGGCTSVTFPDGSAIHSTLNSENRVIGVQGPDQLWYRYEYDPRGLVEHQTFPDGREEYYRHDSRGMLVQMVTSDGTEVCAERDNLGRLRRVMHGGVLAKRIELDEDGRWIGIDLDGWRLERRIDIDGRIVSERQNEYLVIKTYGDAGEILSILDSNGRKVTYEYKEGRVVSVAWLRGTWMQEEWVPFGKSRVHRFEYDRVGNLVLWEAPSGVVETRSYDLRRRLVEQRVVKGSAKILRRRYSYDPGGRLVSKRDSSRGVVEYNYDAAGRLQSVREGGGDFLRLSYDRNGDLETGGLRYLAGHKVLSAGGWRFKYDRNGFLVHRSSERGEDRFTYSQYGMITDAALADGRLVRFEYDPHQRLVRKTVGRSVFRFYWHDEQLWAIRAGDDQLKGFLYLPDEIVPLEHAEGERYFTVHTDHKGKISELIDEEGEVAWRDEDGVWGNRREGDSVDRGSVTCPFGFPGQIRDPDTGFSYNRNRFYWPETAHYLTPDPVGIWGGLDNYRYTYDPINIIDPDGLKCRGKTDDDLLYRGTNMPPAVICKGGFVPKDPNAGLTVYGHIEGVPETGSNWISTTYDQGIAEKFADMAVEKAKYEKAAKDPNFEVGEPWVYIFLNPGCGVEVDCDPDLMKKYGPDPKDTEHEIAFNRSIPPKKIVGYYHKEKGMASFQGCP